MRDDNNTSPGRLRRLWRALRTPSATISVLTLLMVGFAGGVIFWGGFNSGLEASSTLEFCISCHEMRDNVHQKYQECKETVHDSNRTGVRAICSDCHVPHDRTHKMVRKAKAAFEVWGEITGPIDTREKFEAKRMELATDEWTRMSDCGSRECRNFDAMSSEVRKPSVYKKHMAARDAGRTCIDCHKGISHHLPKEYRDPDA